MHPTIAVTLARAWRVAHGARHVAGAVAAATLALATPAAAQRPLPPIRVVTAAWLAEHLTDPSVVVVEVEMGGMMSLGRGRHIPGARTIAWDDIATTRGGLRTELPDAAPLRARLEQLGIGDSTLVVVTTAHEAPMASRFLLTLDWLGLTRLAWLDGGLAAWKAEGRPLTSDAPRVTPARITSAVRTDLVVDAAWITARLGRPGLALVDTRTDGEYVGAGERHGMPSAGHLAGARQLEWEQLFANPEGLRLKPTAELAALDAARASAGDTVVTYCWVGYRASMTYVAARILGLPTRFYDGSYQDWLERKLPVRAGAMP